MIWTGEKNRPVRAYRYCDCATCRGGRPHGSVGFLSGSNARGEGFTIELYDEALYHRIREVVGEHGGEEVEP